MQVTWKSRQGSYNGGPPPSAVHGWLKKLHGVVTFSRSRIRQGRHEIEDARALREYERDRRRSHSRSGYASDGAYEDGARRRSRSRSRPFLHPHHRCRPGYHGMHLRLWGFLTRRRDHMARGLAMREDAERERRHERRRRQRHLADEGLAIRMGAQTLIRPRGSRRRHHSEHGYGHRSRSHRSEPRVIVAQPGETVQVVRSAGSRHGHGHRHRSRDDGYGYADAPPIARTGSSRREYYDERAVPVARTSSSRHGQYDERVVPVVRSAGSHDQYADPGAHVALAAPSSSSHHGHHRHRSRSHRSPSVAYVST